MRRQVTKSVLAFSLACLVAQPVWAEPTADAPAARQLHYRVDPRGFEEIDTDRATDTENGGAARAADAGIFLPYTLAPSIEAGHAWVRALAGYDTAAASMRARSATEAGITSYLALRVDFEHGPGTGAEEDRVGIGGRLQFLTTKQHGIDSAVGLFYEPKDFRSEGNIVGALAVGRRFGPVALFGNALFGSDPEGDDQELGGRISLLYRVTPHFELGWDSRLHYILSTDVKRFGTTTTDWEFAFEPTASLSIGPLALLSEAGLSALQKTGPIGQPAEHRHVQLGLIAMAGAGAVF
jgi:hypothetical protein